jgi:hypothetical protein
MEGWIGTGLHSVRDPEVPPLPGLSCDYRHCFPRLPPWATLWRPSGTLDTMKLVHYRWIPDWAIPGVKTYNATHSGSRIRIPVRGRPVPWSGVNPSISSRKR